jgi:alkylated DNA repair protein alkB family protein 1
LKTNNNNTDNNHVDSTDSGCEIFEIDGIEGLFFIRGYLTVEQQWKLTRNCLLNHLQPPNISNLDAVFGSPQKDLFQRYANAEENAKHSIQKLRWVTLGYQYDWTNRKYYKEKYIQFPLDVEDFSKKICSLISENDYKPEAAILNFYHYDTQLCAHKDDVEDRQDKPIVSISLGNSAVFLIGTESKEDEPIGIKIRSGDVGKNIKEICAFFFLN